MRSNWAYGLLLLVAFLCGTASAAEADGIQAELAKLKDATVMIKVKLGQKEASGSGFLVFKENETGYVLTNDHVIRLSGSTEPAGQVQVVLRSGNKSEQTVRGETVSASTSLDLAVLRIEARNLPEPIPIADSGKLVETLRVSVLGFPFGESLSTTRGNPEITVAQASISSVRRNSAGTITTIQLDGNLNPGNSGGPVVDPAGRLVGVAVAKIDSAGIGFAVPGDQVRGFLKGEADSVTLTTDPAGKITAVCRLLDPLQNIKEVHLNVANAGEVQVPSPGNDGAYPPLSGGKSHSMTREGMSRAVTIISLEAPPGTGEYLVQCRITRNDGSKHHTRAIRVAVKDGKIEGGRMAASFPSAGTPASLVAAGEKGREKPRRLGLDASVEVVAPTGDGSGLFLIRKVEGTPKLFRWDLAGDKLAGEVKVPRSPSAMALRGSEVVVLCPESNVVVFVNPGTNQVANAVECPKGLIPTDICPEGPNGKLYVLCREASWGKGTHVLVEIDPKTRKTRDFAKMEGEAVAVNGAHRAVQTNFAGSPSGLTSISSLEPLGAGPAAKSLGHASFGPIAITGSGDFICADEGGATRSFAADGVTKWSAKGQLLASWPGGKKFLLSTGPADRNWDKIGVCAIDDSGNRLWEHEIDVAVPISGLISRQANLYARPRGFILGTAGVGSFLEAGMKTSPAAITRSLILPSPEGDSLIFCVSVYDGTPNGRFAITLEEVARGWFVATLPKQSPAGQGLPHEVFVGDSLKYTPPAGQTEGTYRLKQGPEGMTIDPKTGTLLWNPNITCLGQHDVEVVLERDARETPMFRSVIRVRTK